MKAVFILSQPLIVLIVIQLLYKPLLCGHLNVTIWSLEISKLSHSTMCEQYYKSTFSYLNQIFNLHYKMTLFSINFYMYMANVNHSYQYTCHVYQITNTCVYTHIQTPYNTLPVVMVLRVPVLSQVELDFCQLGQQKPHSVPVLSVSQEQSVHLGDVFWLWHVYHVVQYNRQ